MKLPTYVKSKTIIGNIIPVIGNKTSQTVYPFIFLSKIAYDNLKSDNPTPQFLAHLTHEETHRKRQKQMGVGLHLIKYFISPAFRFNEELEAHKEAMKIYKKYDIQFDIEKYAKLLSSSLYLWATSYDFAKKELTKAWKSV